VLYALVQRDPALRRLLTVRDWLEAAHCRQTAVVQGLVPGRTRYWPDTVRTVITQQQQPSSGALVQHSQQQRQQRPLGFTTLDPDAPLGKAPGGALKVHPLAGGDQRGERELMSSVWGYVRGGQLAAAVEHCAAAGHNWRAASLAGGGLYDEVSHSSLCNCHFNNCFHQVSVDSASVTQGLD
jgi:Nuclear pore protein 84 / 107